MRDCPRRTNKRKVTVKAEKSTLTPAPIGVLITHNLKPGSQLVSPV